MSSEYKDDGTDDEEAAKYQPVKDDSSSEGDPQLPSVSDDEDRQLMRHILKEKEEQDLLRLQQNQKPKTHAIMIQTTPPKSKNVNTEYVAPPSENGNENYSDNEFEAEEVYEDPDEYEFQAPSTEGNIKVPSDSPKRKKQESQNFQIAITDKKQAAKLMNKYKTGKGDSPLFIPGRSPSKLL